MKSWDSVRPTSGSTRCPAALPLGMRGPTLSDCEGNLLRMGQSA